MIERDPVEREERRFIDFVGRRHPSAYWSMRKMMAEQPRPEFTASRRKNETHPLYLYTLWALSPENPVRTLMLWYHADLERSTLTTLQEATQVLTGENRRWAKATLDRREDLLRRGAVTPSVEESLRFYAQRLACIAHAAHRFEKLHCTRIQSRAA